MSKVMLLMFLSFLTQLFSATYTVDGYAYLEGQTDHRNIQVFFQRVVPDTLFSISTITDSLGYYSCSVEGGYYDVEYTKTGFGDTIIEDTVLFTDQTLADQTLTGSGNNLEGSIKGILQRGEYFVINTLTVPEGDSLIIEPGVILNFSTAANAKFQIYGYLKAEGTETDSIIFRPTETYWSGISITNSIYTSMSYCSILTQENNGFTISGSFCSFNYISIGSFENIMRTGINMTSSIVYINHSKIYAENCLITTPESKGSDKIGKTTELRIVNSLLYSTGMGSILVDKVTFINCTMVAAGSMVGLDTNMLGPSSKILNCSIIAANPYSSAYGIYAGSMDVSCCNVYGFTMGNYNTNSQYVGAMVTTNPNGDPCDAYGNISMDPKFVDAANGDFSLQSASPCIDAGTNTISGYTFPVADLGSCIRIWDGDGDSNAIVDIGAYEYGAPTGIEVFSTTINDCTLFQNYPNPFNPVTSISYALPQASNVELNVYNLNGQLVQSLVNGRLDKGMHKAEFSGADLTSGMYIYNLKVDNKVVSSRKMMLLK